MVDTKDKHSFVSNKLKGGKGAGNIAYGGLETSVTDYILGKEKFPLGAKKLGIFVDKVDIIFNKTKKKVMVEFYKSVLVQLILTAKVVLISIS